MIPRFATSGTMPLSALSLRSSLAMGSLEVLRQHCGLATPRREPLQPLVMPHRKDSCIATHYFFGLQVLLCLRTPVFS
jgi:hypothetical protein